MMKYMIASDVHGSASWCRRMLEVFRQEQADRLVLLGDLLYHGPRNDLPDEYAPKQVIAMLSAPEAAGRLLCVRGNCDAEVDQMVLPFPILADYAILTAGDRLIYATHGHVYNKGHLPPLRSGDILLHGHTHVPVCEELGDGRMLVNPGSVSLPKENSCHGYMILSDDSLLWKDLEEPDASAWMTMKL